MHIPWALPSISENEKKHLEQAITGNWISQGEFIKRFETDFAEFQQHKHAFTVCNGTGALQLAYLALGLKAGDEIIVPGYGFMAAANVALELSMSPVFVDVDPKTWCLDPAKIEQAITPRTRAIVAVDTYGNICDMGSINAIAAKHKLAVIEDAAEAIGSKYRGQMAGKNGIIGTFSFHAAKTITTGEGGMVVTDSDKLAEKLRLFRSHGVLSRYYFHEVAGHNFRMSNLHAAIGCGQMERVEELLTARQKVFLDYYNNLKDSAVVSMQQMVPEVEPVVWAIAVRLDPDAFPNGRDAVQEQMKALGIETRPGFAAADEMKIYSTQPLPASHDLSRNIICLPGYVGMEKADIAYVCKALLKLAG